MRKVAAIAVAVLPLMLSACTSPLSVLDTASPAADILAQVGWFVLVLGSVVSVIVLVLVIIPVTRRRGTLDDHLPYDERGGTKWVAYGGFVVPAIILGVLFFVTMATLARFPLSEPEDPETDVGRTGVAAEAAMVRVIGHQWWWEVKYEAGVNQWVTTANEIKIPVGRTILVALETADVIHSFWVPRLHGKVDLIPGQVNYIRIQADTAGVYRGRCAEFCGAQHTHMEFLVVAQPEEEYRQWLAHEASPAVEPTTAAAIDGRKIFTERACAFCHTIRGVSPGGTVAPDLTHLASRRTIAAGLLPNRHQYLEAWVLNAPSLKPGTQMPAMTQFTGQEIRSLVTYLESLK